MTDWQSRLDAKLNAKRESLAAEPVHCDECGVEVRFPCTSGTRARGDVPQCFECWWKNKLATGEEKWWTKPQFDPEGKSRESQSKRSRRTSKRG